MLNELYIVTNIARAQELTHTHTQSFIVVTQELLRQTQSSEEEADLLT